MSGLLRCWQAPLPWYDGAKKVAQSMLYQQAQSVLVSTFVGLCTRGRRPVHALCAAQCVGHKHGLGLRRMAMRASLHRSVEASSSLC
eukprot:3506808-Amphidinium_carterae.1